MRRPWPAAAALVVVVVVALCVSGTLVADAAATAAPSSGGDDDKSTAALLAALDDVELAPDAAAGDRFFDAARSLRVLPTLRVWWRVDRSAAQLYVRLRARTAGWLALGLAEATSGSMPGADIALAWVDDADGSVRVEDRYATEKATPQLDDACQSWTALAGRQWQATTHTDATTTTASASATATYTEVVLTRALDTHDTQDRVVHAGLQRIVAAHSSFDSDLFVYHGANRAANAVVFFSDKDTDDANADANVDDADANANANSSSPPPTRASFDFRMVDPVDATPYSIPATTTTYACIVHPLLPLGAQQAVRYEVLLNASNAGAERVHHMLVWTSRSTTPHTATRLGKGPLPCNSFVAHDGMQLVYAWARGVGPLELPDDVFFGFGDDALDAGLLAIEVHYDNPPDASGASPDGLADDSGVRVTVEPLGSRTHEAAVLYLGDPGASHNPLPPRTPRTHVELDCPAVCTSKLTAPLNMFASMQHMHRHGRQMWSTVTRGDASATREPINSVDFYDYDFQQVTPLVEHGGSSRYTLQPGDALHTHCVFSTADSERAVDFGVASADEMCMEFLWYWPKRYVLPGVLAAVFGGAVDEPQPFTYCGLININAGLREYIASQLSEDDAALLRSTDNYTWCGGPSLDAAALLVENPALPDGEASQPTQWFGTSIADDAAALDACVARGAGTLLSRPTTLTVLVRDDSPTPLAVADADVECAPRGAVDDDAMPTLRATTGADGSVKWRNVAHARYKCTAAVDGGASTASGAVVLEYAVAADDDDNAPRKDTATLELVVVVAAVPTTAPPVERADRLTVKVVRDDADAAPVADALVTCERIDDDNARIVLASLGTHATNRRGTVKLHDELDYGRYECRVVDEHGAAVGTRRALSRFVLKRPTQRIKLRLA